MSLCPPPPGVSKCPPIQTYNSGGTFYAAFEFCDQGNNATVIAVFQLCDGVPSGPPTYYDTQGAVYTPVGAVGPCKGSADYEVICDKGTNPATQVVALWDTSVTPPKLDYFTYSLTGVLTAYTPVGPLGACSGADIEDTQVCYIAVVAGTGYAAGDQILQISFWDTSTAPPSLVSTLYKNQTQGTVLAAAPPFADLTSCGGQSPVTLLLCDEYPTPCEPGNLLVDANWTTSGSITDSGVNSFIFSDQNRPIDGIVTQTVNVTVGSSYTFTATVSRQGAGAGNTQALIQVFDGATLLAGGTFPNGSAVNFPGLISVGGTLTVKATDATTGTTLNSDVIVSAMALNCVTPVNKKITTQFLRQICVACGAGTPKISDFNLDGVTAYTVKGTVKNCGTSGTLEVICRCDDRDADTVAEYPFKSIVSIDSQGVTTVLASYEQDLVTPYTPVSPGTCSVPGDNLVRVVPNYKVISGVGLWTLGADSVLPTVSASFTVITVGNPATPPTLTTAAGTYPLFSGQAAGWSSVYSRDVSGLKPPLILTCHAGDTVAVLWESEAI